MFQILCESGPFENLDQQICQLAERGDMQRRSILQSITASVLFGLESSHETHANRRLSVLEEFRVAGWKSTYEQGAKLAELIDALMSVKTIVKSRNNGQLYLAPFSGSDQESIARAIYYPGQDVGFKQSVLSQGSQSGLQGAGGNGQTPIDIPIQVGRGGKEGFTVLIALRSSRSLYSDPSDCKLRLSYRGGKTNICLVHRAYKNGLEVAIGGGPYSNLIELQETFQEGVIGMTYRPEDEDLIHVFGTYGDTKITIRTTVENNLDQMKRLDQVSQISLLGFEPNNACSRDRVLAAMLCPAISVDEQIKVLSAFEKYVSVPVWSKEREKLGKSDIWVLAGQSNMSGQQTSAGQSRNLSGDDADNLVAGLFQVEGKNPASTRIARAKLPLDFDPGPGVRGVGPGFYFGRRILELRPLKSVILVPSAVGASSFSAGDWRPTGVAFRRMIERTQFAMEQGGTYRGMIWVQGEGDTSLSDERYQIEWTDMYTRLLSQLSVSYQASIVLFGQLAKPSLRRDSTMKLLSERLPRASYISEKESKIAVLLGDEAFDDSSMIHYSVLAQRIIGRTMGDIAARL